MKLSLIALLAVLLIITKASVGDPKLRRGAELVEWIEGSLPGTIVVLLFDKDASSQRTSEVRQQLKAKILNQYPDFHYYEVDVSVQDFDQVVELVEIDKKLLKHSPAILIASDGNGYWAHGQGAVAEIVYQLPFYAVELQGRDSAPTRR
mmetsp:Transcript_27027/g.23856  ORF Transcript_27027/g.23856 Transcript_27027/m.23856 type:complete len:149 (+) Transcript_27027:29-475(+)|eukprot:CAMPEP_0205805746 /NCGR_PEP_ID=MMETSP0205-20121125/9070_1 /ASSEMBLY_ACC=CAM_ASM_000278 /TAXON_ID=36767 /ORGANISM="Euplotes focardii, Strain TN1" /LENGTH=148 /DNA_ID=CAMNT_0053077473 /DNA_START=23 /DNA_END=469 /DNA_ORIENTATION=+